MRFSNGSRVTIDQTPIEDRLRGLSPIPEAEISDTQDRIAEESLEEESLALKEMRLQQMLIENPLEAEKLLMDGELGDEESVEDRS